MYILYNSQQQQLSQMAKQPIKYCVVDAFTDSAFKGNPAAVCFLEEERDEEWLQSLAAEFNVSQTGYLTRICAESSNGSLVPRFRLRWFTPVTEVKLCGHATLAASHVIFSSGLVNSNIIEFITLSGVLTARKVVKDTKSEKFSIELNFPAVQTTVCDSIEVSSISKVLNGASVIELKMTTTEKDLLVVLPSGKNVVDFEPTINEIQKLPGRGLIITGVTSPGSGFDFFSRFFCPKYGLPEDPVCGSAHCALAPYWSKKLGKNDLVAYQASPRGGILELHLDEQNQRVLLRGEAVTVMEGSILV